MSATYINRRRHPENTLRFLPLNPKTDREAMEQQWRSQGVANAIKRTKWARSINRMASEPGDQND